MKCECSNRQLRGYLLCGLLGCLLMGGSDWLMIYGDTAYEGSLAWLTLGVAQIPPERNALALLLAFPAVVLYAVALFAVRVFFTQEGDRKWYSALTALGLTPWLCLHLFYVMILYAFGWLQSSGQTELSYALCEAMFGQFSWVVLVAEVLMLLPFLFLLVQVFRGRSVFPRVMGLNNPLLLYVVLKLLTGLMPDVPARLAFTNGLMSEAMFLWFLVFLGTLGKYRKAE